MINVWFGFGLDFVRFSLVFPVNYWIDRWFKCMISSMDILSSLDTTTTNSSANFD